MPAYARTIISQCKKTFAGMALYLFSCMGSFSVSAADKYCTIMVGSREDHKLHIRGCEVGGNLYLVGPFVAGRLVIDLQKLYHWDRVFNKVLRENLSKSSRYASLELTPFNWNDREFTGVLKFNGIKGPVKGHVITVTKDSVEARVPINLAEFNFAPNDYPSTIVVTARVRSSKTPKK